ncbi:MAG: hypothetical protein H8E31_04885 [Planctomycetes bacterium]|nr:hypothetical protein [Planctomycetota bacterium]
MEGGQELLLSAERLRGPGRPRIPFSPVRITGSLVVDRELQATFAGPGTYRWRWALGGPKARGTSLAIQLGENPGGEWRIEEASHGTTLEIEPPAELSAGGSGG